MTKQGLSLKSPSCFNTRFCELINNTPWRYEVGMVGGAEFYLNVAKFHLKIYFITFDG